MGEVKSIRAQALGINRKNIYYQGNKQALKDAALREAINKVWIKHPSYGHKRLGLELNINHKRVSRVMKIFGLKPPRRKSHYYTTRSTSHHTYTNLIKDLKPNKISQLWCSDLSYIKFQGKFWYLATIVDIFTRQVVAAQMGKYHNSELVLTTVKQAVTNIGRAPQIFHTDQGTEFMAKVCTEYLESLGTLISVSDKASPWQNGYQESFFGKFKDEAGDLNRFETAGELIEAVYQQIHYYNYERIHTSLKMPPAVYARLVTEYGLNEMGT